MNRSHLKTQRPFYRDSRYVTELILCMDDLTDGIPKTG